MNDSEKVHRCGELIELFENEFESFDPLGNDAHAFLIIEHLGLSVSGPHGGDTDPQWYVFNPRLGGVISENKDLKRAIVDCASQLKTLK